jgi:hypothetical protein
MAIEKGVREGTQIIADKIASSNPALTIMSKKVEARKETVIYLVRRLTLFFHEILPILTSIVERGI